MRRFTGSPTLLWMVWRRCLGSWSRGRSVETEWVAQWGPTTAQGLRSATSPFSLEAEPRELQRKMLPPGPIAPPLAPPNPSRSGAHSSCFHLSLTTPIQEEAGTERVSNLFAVTQARIQI